MTRDEALNLVGRMSPRQKQAYTLWLECVSALWCAEEAMEAMLDDDGEGFTCEWGEFRTWDDVQDHVWPALYLVQILERQLEGGGEVPPKLLACGIVSGLYQADGPQGEDLPEAVSPEPDVIAPARVQAQG